MSEPTHSDVQEPFEVHRRVGLLVALVVVPLLLALGYAWVAYDDRDPVSAGVAIVLALVGLAFAPSLRDVRSPLLVADLHGLRLQGRHGWVGLLWREIEQIRVVPRHGLRGPEISVAAEHAPETYLVPLGLATDVGAGRAEIELARRRDAAPY